MTGTIFSLGGLLFFWIPILGGIGLIFSSYWPWGVGSFVLGGIYIFLTSERYSERDDLISDYWGEYHARNNELIHILYAIGQPELSNGYFSNEQMYLFELYQEEKNSFDIWNDAMTERLFQ